jgi:maltose-binding protein MalE
MNIRRMNLLLVLLIISSMLLAACGGAQPTPTAAPAATEATGGGAGAAPTTAPAATTATEASPEAEATAAGTGGTGAAGGASLVLWTRETEDTPAGVALREVAQTCADQTGNKVEVQVVPDAEYKNKLSLAAPVGEGPDIGGPIAHDWIGEFAAQDIALEINNDRVSDMAGFNEAGVQGFSYEGKLYGLPVFVESVALFWNKDIAGDTPPATFEELIEKSKEYTKDDQYGFVMPILEQYHTYGFLTGYGGYIFKYDPAKGYDINDVGINNEGAVKGVELIKQIVDAKIMPESVMDRTNMHSISTETFSTGKAAYTINGPWTIEDLKKNNINFGVAPIPALPDGEAPKPFMGIQGFFVSAYSKSPEQALAVVDCMTNEESTVTLAQGYNKVPARAASFEAAFKDNTDFAGFAEQAENAVPMPNIPEMSQVWKPWGDALDVAVPGTAEIKPTMDTAAEQIKAAIEAFRK